MTERGRPSIYTPEIAAKGSASIYALLDPITLELRYIGKANDPKKRLATHLSDSKKRDAPVCRWIRKVGVPKMVVILTDCADWQSEERRLISEARADGFRLLNVSDGGNQPWSSETTLAENGKKSAIARVSTPEKRRLYRLKRTLSAALARGELSEGVKIKMRTAARKMPEAFGSWAHA